MADAKKSKSGKVKRFFYRLFPYRFTCERGLSGTASAAVIFSFLTAASAFPLFLGNYFVSCGLYAAAGVILTVFLLSGMKKTWLAPISAIVGAAAVIFMNSPIACLVCLQAAALFALSFGKVKKPLTKKLLLIVPFICAVIPLAGFAVFSILVSGMTGVGLVFTSVFPPLMLSIALLLVSCIEASPEKAGRKAPAAQ